LPHLLAHNALDCTADLLAKTNVGLSSSSFVTIAAATLLLKHFRILDCGWQLRIDGVWQGSRAEMGIVVCSAFASAVVSLLGNKQLRVS
jgi:hypothetical protein